MGSQFRSTSFPGMESISHCFCLSFECLIHAAKSLSTGLPSANTTSRLSSAFCCLGHLPSLSLNDFTASHQTFHLNSCFIPHKANGVQLLFSEWNQFAIAFGCLLMVHPICQVLQHWFTICQHHLSLVLCLIASRPPPLLSLNLFTAQNMACHSCSRLHKANGVQHLFPEWNQFAIALCCLLIIHPHCQVPQHWFTICQHHLSLVLCLIFRLGHLFPFSLNLFTAQNMACHSCSHLSHMKRIEFNFLSLSSAISP